MTTAKHIATPIHHPLPPLPPLDRQGRVLYFAYGSNLDPRQMSKRCPHAKLLYAASLPGYRISFVGYSNGWGGAVATLVEDAKATTEGLVYSLSASDVRFLDAHEGVPYVYERTMITMTEDDGKARPCMLYLHGRPVTLCAPSKRYFDQIRRAYSAEGFDTAPLHRAVKKFAPVKRKKETSDKPAQKRGVTEADMTTDTHPHLVFVYGSLRRGLHNHSVMERANGEFIGEDVAHDFTMVDMGAFPAVVRGGTTAVTGELYRTTEEGLAVLDRLEGHPRFYMRQRVRLASGLVVWIYVQRPDALKGRKVVTSGDWLEYVTARDTKRAPKVTDSADTQELRELAILLGLDPDDESLYEEVG